MSATRRALSGVLAAGVALGAAELLGGLVPGVGSLVVAVGGAVIDLVPGWLERWAIRTLGTADKPVLLIGIVLTCAALGGLLGLAAARRRAVGAAGFVGFAALGALAAAVRPGTSPPAAGLVAAAAAGAGIAALTWLLRRADRASTPASSDDGGAQPIGPRPDRRAFLHAALTVTATAAISAAAGRYLVTRRSVATARAAVTLPPPAVSAPPPPPTAAVDVEGVVPFVIPNDRFYRIDTALVVPQVDASGWRLGITGMVERPYELTYDDLLAMPLVERYVTIACVSNEVGGNLIGNAAWLGVPLEEVLARAGVAAEADQVVGRSVNGFTAGFPTAAAFDGRGALVAVGMNGEPLPAAHGFPARLIVPGLYGYVSATKWLAEIELTTFAAFDAYWIPRGWARFGPILTQSRIERPRPGATFAAGPTAIAGTAWAPTRGIERVQVQIDEQPWADAELAVAYSADTWRQWVLRWEATPGRHRIRVRATDGTGETQTGETSPPAPDGARGWHTVTVTVTGVGIRSP